MISTPPPRYRGEKTQFKPGDIIEINRLTGCVGFIRGEDRLQMNAQPLDKGSLRDSLECSHGFTVPQAVNMAKLIGIATRLEIKSAGEDGMTSRFVLLEPARSSRPDDTPM